MRKVIVAAIVASALFAVGAFAASFTISSEDVASGSDPVSACATSVDVDFTTVYDEASDWNVPSAVVTFYSGGTTTTTACAGFGATLAIERSGTASDVLGEAPVPAGASSVTVPLNTVVKASEIVRASVLVDGKELTVATPGGGDGDTGITPPG